MINETANRGNPLRQPRRAGVGSKGKGRGSVVVGLLIRRISEEGPISNIKGESDRSEDDPDRSEGIRTMTEAKEGRS